MQKSKKNFSELALGRRTQPPQHKKINSTHHKKLTMTQKVCTCKDKNCINPHSCDWCYDYNEMSHVSYGSCCIREATCLKCLLRDWIVNEETRDKVIQSANEVYKTIGKKGQTPRWDDEQQKRQKW